MAEQFTTRRTPQQISNFENGLAVPELPVLVELYFVLHGPATADTPTESGLLQWLAAWLRTKKIPNPEASSIFMAAVDMLNLVSKGRPLTNSRPITSVADFPGGEPFTIILGDRRDTRAVSAADCLIYSGSVTDAMYLTHLGEHMTNATIKSDKILAKMPTDYLKDSLGKRNLLIVGSPAVNLGARILNDEAVFPFRIDRDPANKGRRVIADHRMQDQIFASEFHRFTQSETQEPQHKFDRHENDEPERAKRDAAIQFARDILSQSTAKAFMNKFRTFGILDPADQENHGTSIHQANDFAVVTLARNPYCSTGDYRAVICAGIHGPGTAAALHELLTSPKTFADRPLGAVLEVELNLSLDWVSRFEKPRILPQTKPYTRMQVLQNLRRAIADPSLRKSVYDHWSDGALESTAKFVEQLVGERRDSN
ncbi:MAG: hypothetical protein ACRDRX_27240 [Pseudonocardiaceae bacterium]